MGQDRVSQNTGSQSNFLLKVQSLKNIMIFYKHLKATTGNYSPPQSFMVLEQILEIWLQISNLPLIRDLKHFRDLDLWKKN